jgi:hypothetical protein
MEKNAIVYFSEGDTVQISNAEKIFKECKKYSPSLTLVTKTCDVSSDL